MNLNTALWVVSVTMVAGCGATAAVPAQRLEDAQSATRMARNLGAEGMPPARPYLRLAEEQTAAANIAIVDGDNSRAEYLLVRAQADAELALAMAREERAKTLAQQAIEQAKAAPPAKNEDQGGRR